MIVIGQIIHDITKMRCDITEPLYPHTCACRYVACYAVVFTQIKLIHALTFAWYGFGVLIIAYVIDSSLRTTTRCILLIRHTVIGDFGFVQKLVLT